jgi:hypothetical protein
LPGIVVRLFFAHMHPPVTDNPADRELFHAAPICGFRPTLRRPPRPLATSGPNPSLNFSQKRGWGRGFDTPRAANSSMMTDAIN